MRKLLFPLFIVFLAIVSGCEHRPRSFWPDGAAETLDRYYKQYLDGDGAEARSATTNAIALMLSVDARAHGRAHGLWLGYSRLFALEKHDGNDAEALASFATAKDWYRAKLEASEYTSQEINQTLQEFTPESCLEIVQGFDDANTKGKGPRYLQETDDRTKTQPGTGGNR